ncbi:hypothetical protein C8J56DRAFT_1037606 [Mycena floridula]|nr:hypothetical protein C8J56DRAFT_1037606 [Mycena floridula]
MEGTEDPREDVEWIYPIGLESTLLKRGAVASDLPGESSSMTPEDSVPLAHYDDHWTYLLGYEEQDQAEPPHLLVTLDPEMIQQFVHGYANDRTFQTTWKETASATETLLTPSHF